MADPLTLLDAPIDRMTSAVSSRCSRSGVNAAVPTGTVKPLKIDTVPVVPVVPGQNGQICEDDAQSDEDSCEDFLPAEKAAHASTIRKITGTTGTAGTGLINQKVSRSQIFFENGNNGNNGNCDNLPSGATVGAVRACGLGTAGGGLESEARSWELPDGPCSSCGCGDWWRLSILSGGPGPWQCGRCGPPHPEDWVDACAVAVA